MGSKININARSVAENAIVAALYFILTVVITPLAYGQFNFRLSELLVLLCFWRPDFVIGVTLGCFLTNIGSTMGWYDMVFGTLSTLFSSILIAASPKLLIACLWPILVNAFVVGAELYYVLGLPFWINVGYVGAGEGIVIIASYIIWMIMWRRKDFARVFGPRRKAVPNW